MANYNKPYIRTQRLIINEVEVTATAAELNANAGLTATAAEVNKAADVSSNTVEYTESAAVADTVQHLELNHATVVVAMTIADLADHQGLFTVKDTSASGTAAHTVTLTAGSFNGTNKIATFNAPGEAITIFVDSAGNGVVLVNTGSVAFSG